jgi:hypothetical protein
MYLATRATLPLLCVLVGSALAQPLLPWQRMVDKPEPSEVRSLDGLTRMPWVNSGGDSGTLGTSEEPGPWGGSCLDFRVRVSHSHPGPYAAGWPSFELRPEPALDWSGFTALRYWIRCDTDVNGPLPIRLILWTAGEGRVNEVIPGVRRGEWVQVTQPLTGIPSLEKVDRVHFFVCEIDYPEGTALRFQVGGFELVRYEKELAKVAPSRAAMALYVGERADTSERIVIPDEGTPELPALLAVETGSELTLQADDELLVRYHEVFTARDTPVRARLERDLPAGQVTRWMAPLALPRLVPGYYLVVADVRRGGKSLLGGVVGSDDLYIRRQDETMTETVLSLRAGMVLWLRDLLNGDIMGWAHAALPHSWDPLDKATYGEFLKAFATSTGKHTEGNEAGDTGLALAAEAFRKGGDRKRARFAEWLLEDSYRHMIDRMQAPSGGCIMWTDELGDAGLGYGRSQTMGTYDVNQMGEWMRALDYGIITYAGLPGRAGKTHEWAAACRKAGDFMVKHSLMDSDGVPGVLRHFTLSEGPDGLVQRSALYQQEGRQCDVYLGRALSGLGYTAYAMQALGEEPPAEWWPVMENTVRWAGAKMKPNGWFDWQCEDTVEGGCHTFLGNLYIGEAAFGVAIAARSAGKPELAREAAEVARRAYRYVTDDCVIKGVRYDVPAAAEFWVGPYVYWLFTEWIDAFGPEPGLQSWLTGLDKLWSEDHAWKDFLDRPRDGTGYVGRAADNGMLNVAILGYLGIKRMAEIGQPMHWR